MPAIIEFPTVVEEVLSQYREVFGTEAARRHFAEYLTGLMIAEHKTVSGPISILPNGNQPGVCGDNGPVVPEPLVDPGRMGCG